MSFDCLDISYYLYVDMGGYPDISSLLELSHQQALKKQWLQLLPSFPEDHVHVLSSLEEVIGILDRFKEPLDVLVTGSLHFVGAFFRAIDLSVDNM